MRDERHGFLRWWLIPVAVAAVVIVGFGVTMILFLTREDPDPMPVEDVIAAFRSTTTSSTTTSAPRPERSTTTSSVALLRPPEGVYVMEGEGGEAISFPPVSQDDGETMPATITHDPDGCWTFTLFYNEAHWQDWQLCPDGDDLVEMGGHTFQRWDFGVTTVENLSTFVCDPPALFLVRDADEGSTRSRSCDGTNDRVDGTTRSAGTLTFVGVEALLIGEESLDALHVRRDNVLSGAQTGGDVSDLWFSAIDGLPLRGEREAVVESDSPIGDVSYTEQGWWQLASTIPAG